MDIVRYVVHDEGYQVSIRSTIKMEECQIDMWHHKLQTASANRAKTTGQNLESLMQAAVGKITKCALQCEV